MQASGFSFVEFLLILAYHLPFGLPPAPEDPQLSCSAPKECAAYLTWNGTQEPAADSSNKTENLLADAEFGRFTSALDTSLLPRVKSIVQSVPPEMRPTMEKLIEWVLNQRRHAASVTVTNLNPFQGSFDVVVVCNVKETGEETRELLASVEQIIVETGPAKPTTTKDGEFESKSVALPGVPQEICWSMRGDYLIFAFGKDAFAQQLKDWNNEREPAWLESAKQNSPIDRRGHLLMVDVEPIVNQFVALAPPDFTTTLEFFGLDHIKRVVDSTGIHGADSISRFRIETDGEVPDILSPILSEKVDLSFVPQDARIVLAAAVDLPELLVLAINGSDTVYSGWGSQLESALAEAEPALGGSVREGIVEALGPNMVIYNSPSEHGDGIPHVTLAIEVAKMEAFRSIYEHLMSTMTAIYAEQPNLKQTEGKDGTVVNSLIGVLPMPLSWTLTDSHLLISSELTSILKTRDRAADFQGKSLDTETQPLTSNSDVAAYGYLDVQHFAPMLQPLLPMLARNAPAPIPPEFLESLPSAAKLKRHLTPFRASFSKSKAAVEITLTQTLPPMTVIPAMAANIALGNVGGTQVQAIPAVRLRPARQRARMAQGQNQLKQLALAMLNYESAYGEFPPAYLKTEDGKPGLSWRVAILPFLEKNDLYQKFKLDEPWDSDNNKKLIAEMPEVFRSPRSKEKVGKSNFLAIRHKASILSGEHSTNMRDIQDGTSNTLLCVEVDDEHAIEWTKPADFELKKGKEKEGLGMPDDPVISVVFSDGASTFISKEIDLETLIALITRDGAETIDRRAVIAR